MNLAEVDTTYEPYSRDPRYVELNRCLVNASGCEDGHDVVDNACGAGVLGALAWHALMRSGRDAAATLTAVDLSPLSLALSRARYEQSSSMRRAIGERRVTFIQASGDCIALPDGSVDRMLMGNAIHLFADKRRLLTEMARLVRPSGRFGFNTAFYAGTFPAGTDHFYRLWLREAVFRIRAEARAEGQRIVRVRDARRPAFSEPWLSPSDYVQLMEAHGFTVVSVEERTVSLSRHALEAVGGYVELAKVLLAGYPERLACRALAEAVPSALERAGLDDVPRRWLEVVGARRL